MAPNEEGCGGYGCSPPPPAPAPAPLPFPFLSAPPSPSPSPCPAVAVAPSPFDNHPSASFAPGSRPNTLRTLVVVASTVLATCALLLIYYAVLRRYRSLRRRRALAAAAAAAAAAGGAVQPGPGEEEELWQDLLVGGGGEDPYHVWYIRTAGLDEGTIGGIPAYGYRRGEGLVDATDCAVCLGEFRDGEMLRLLPKCAHAFHIPCIDTWLRSHVNCPLCRAPILAPSDAAHIHSASPPPASSSSSSSSSPDAAAAGSMSSRRLMLPDGAAEDRNAAAVPSPAQDEVFHHLGSSSFSDEDSDAWVPIDLGNGRSEEQVHIESDASAAVPAAGRNGHGELQQLRRSISMDSSALGGLLLRMGLWGEERRKPTSEGNPSATKNGDRRGSICKGSPWPDASPGMERSMSSSGGRVFLSRFSGRPPRSAILPL